MSKLYKEYLKKKEKDPNKLYLFKSGVFYIFLGDDAKEMSEKLNISLTKFSKLSDKCGFPIQMIDAYKKFLEIEGYDYEIVLNVKDYIIDDIKNSNNLTKDDIYKRFIKYKEMLIEDEQTNKGN